MKHGMLSKGEHAKTSGYLRMTDLHAVAWSLVCVRVCLCVSLCLCLCLGLCLYLVTNIVHPHLALALNKLGMYSTVPLHVVWIYSGRPAGQH